MADNVQWLKIKVGMFDGNSFKKIKRAKIGGVSYRDKLTAVWFELLDLAGKSNSNGYLIDNNEIPYHSFDEIAIMLDREEKEIELCMQFFINEKMVEIIDDIYCLTNFVKYQNKEGLDKIREQKRIAQSKWRERKRLGLIDYQSECVDKKTSTQTSTDNLPSISISNSNIFNYWNNKDIIKHKELTDAINKAIIKALKTYTEEEIKEYIDRYDKVLKDKNWYFDTKWTLAEFLTQKNGINDFTDEGSKWINYQQRHALNSDTQPTLGRNTPIKQEGEGVFKI